MTNQKSQEKTKKTTKTGLPRGKARWAGISKKDRSTEMSRVAKVKSAKYLEYKKIAENLTTQA
jgi:hypothetical protein